MEPEVQALIAFVTVVAVISAVALASRRLGVPDDLALLAVGLAAALAFPGAIELHPSFVLAVLLPGLVFAAAYGIEWQYLRRALWAIGLLAVPGVVLTAAIVAVALAAFTGLDPALAFVAGAMLAATDPASMTAAFARLRVPKGLSTVVEGESLMNDGVGIVLFSAALAFVAGGASIGYVAGGVIVAIAGSIAIGTALGFLVSRLVASVDDYVVEITLSIALAYGAYLIADALGISGLIATVVAGIVLGNYGQRVGMSERTRGAVETFWSVIAFVLTAVVFLLVGSAIDLTKLPAALPFILWATAAVIVARAVTAYGLVALVGRALTWARRRRGIPDGWLHVVFWSGLRGAVAVALALSLPADLPRRQELQEIVFGVVLITIVVQGSTAAFVVRRALGGRPAAEAHEETVVT